MNFSVVAKTRGRGRSLGWSRDRGRGVLFFPDLFGFNFCRHSPVLLLSNDRGICPSFMVENFQKIKELMEAMKGLQGHVFLANFKVEVGFCEHLAFSFRKSEFVFGNQENFRNC